MNEQERVHELLKTVDNLKRENTQLRNVVNQRNAELKNMRQEVVRARRAKTEKHAIGAAMHRFAQRENSFK